MKNLYENLYREAWAHFEFYWNNEGVKCEVVIEHMKLDSKGGDSVLDTYVKMRGHSIHVHKVIQIAGVKNDIWKRAVKELLKTGAVKIYESTVMMKRMAPIEHINYDNRYFPLPLTVTEAKNDGTIVMRSRSSDN